MYFTIYLSSNLFSFDVVCFFQGSISRRKQSREWRHHGTYQTMCRSNILKPFKERKSFEAIKWPSLMCFFFQGSISRGKKSREWRHDGTCQVLCRSNRVRSLLKRERALKQWNDNFQCSLTVFYREVYLDGNNLESEGTMELIKLCVDQAELEAFQRNKKKKEWRCILLFISAAICSVLMWFALLQGSIFRRKQSRKWRHHGTYQVMCRSSGAWSFSKK